MPGKSSAPALRRTIRLSRSSCLTDFDLYPLVRSSPTVPGLVTRPLCRVTRDLSIARLARRPEVAQEEDIEVHEEELVPRDRGLEGLARVSELGPEHARDGRLRQAHGAHHELRRDLAPWSVLAVAVRERDREEVINEAVRHRDLGRLAEPPSQTVLAPLEPLPIGRAVLAHEELRRLGKAQEVVVERFGQRRLVLEHERRRASYRLDVCFSQAHEGHLLADEAFHVRTRMRGQVLHYDILLLRTAAVGAAIPQMS